MGTIARLWTALKGLGAKAKGEAKAAAAEGEKSIATEWTGIKTTAAETEEAFARGYAEAQAAAAKAQQGVQAASMIGKAGADAAFGAAENGIAAGLTGAEALAAEAEQGIATGWTGLKTLPARAWAASGLTKLAVGVGAVVVIGLIAAAAAGVFGGSAPGDQQDKAALLASQTSTTQPSQSQTSTTQQSASQTTAITTQQTKTASPTGASNTWLLWDWSSRTGKPPFSWNPTWHVVLTGDSKSGTVTIPEDKTVTATYQADGDKLTIDITRILGPENPQPQKFHYEFTGYPSDDWTGTILVGRIGNDTSVTAWSEPRDARATRGLNTPPTGTGTPPSS